MLRQVRPEVGRRRAGAVIARLLTQRTPPAAALFAASDASEDEDDRIAHLATPSGLASIGIDVGGGAIVVPSPTDDAMVIAFELVNRPRFEGWLASLAPGEPRRLAIGGEQASVLEPANGPAITCLSRKDTAYCQIGESSGADPIAMLRGVVSVAPPLLTQSAGLVRAFARLPEDAHAYAVINPEQTARLALRSLSTHVERAHRYDAPEKRRAAEQRSAALAQRIRRTAEMIDGAALALVQERDRLVVRTELALSDRGRKGLREVLPSSPTTTTDAIARWSDTPALARLLLRLKGEDAERLAASFGVSLPQSSLSGTFALLVLGVDPESPLTRPSDDPSPLGWAFLAPSAIAVGLKGASAAEGVQRTLGRLFGPNAPADPSAARDRTRVLDASANEPYARGRVALAGRAFGSTYEVNVLDDLLVAGAGPGSGAAAMRRLNALPAPRRSNEGGLVLAEGALHLRAIDAALDAGSFPAESRRELVMLEALRKRVRPLLEHVEGVTFEVRAAEAESRVRIDVAVER